MLGPEGPEEEPEIVPDEVENLILNMNDKLAQLGNDKINVSYARSGGSTSPVLGARGNINRNSQSVESFD